MNSPLADTERTQTEARCPHVLFGLASIIHPRKVTSCQTLSRGLTPWWNQLHQGSSKVPRNYKKGSWLILKTSFSWQLLCFSHSSHSHCHSCAKHQGWLKGCSIKKGEKKSNMWKCRGGKSFWKRFKSSCYIYLGQRGRFLNYAWHQPMRGASPHKNPSGCRAVQPTCPTLCPVLGNSENLLTHQHALSTG